MRSNVGASGPPGDPPSPAKLWHEAKGDHDKYIALMKQHGHIVDAPEPLEQDPWEQVALLASMNPVDPNAIPNMEKVLSEANAPICSKCRTLISLTEKGFVKVHFAKSEDLRPCPTSYQPWSG